MRNICVLLSGVCGLLLATVVASDADASGCGCAAPTRSSCSRCATPNVTVHICRPPEKRSHHAPKYRAAPEYRAAAAIPTTARIIESVPMMYAPVYAAPAPMRTIAMPTTQVRMVSTAAAPRAAERSLDDCPAGCQSQLNELSSDIDRLAGELNKLQSTVEKQTELLKDIYSRLPAK